MKDDKFRYKSIRDPLYGFIDLSEIEIKVIDSAVFRRLQNIKQLSHAYVVYPTAIHTRFEHALGATHLADRISIQLGFNDEIREVVRLSALLHDIGHGPFSHLFEEILSIVNHEKISHDKISTILIKTDPELNEILGDKVDKIIQLLDHQQVNSWSLSDSTLATDIISGALDVDKMDYLRRDSYHIGVAYGQFDLARIIHTITSTPDPDEKRICIKDKGKDAIENYRLGRYLMHAQVYQHHARLTADQMFLRALDLAVNDEDIIPNNKLKVNTKSLTANNEFVEFFKCHDDRSIYDLIIGKNPNSKAATLLKDIQKRRLLKRSCQILPDKEVENAIIRDRVMKMQYSDLKSFSKEIAEKLSLEYYNIIAYLSEIPVGLYEGEILILWKNIPRKLDDFSPITITKAAVNNFYVFSKNEPEPMNRIDGYVKNKFGMTV